ncbi:MAG: nucleotidyl transferase AbiEii/AbiGii toxin family protein [Nitrosotalea sp.]
MIQDQVLRKLSRTWNLRLDGVEKHYVLGWILYGVSQSSMAKNLAFKGGTSLSKIYFPSDWRLSEDLDFTILDDVNLDKIVKALGEEVPETVKKTGGIELRQKEKPHTNQDYLQYKMGYTGPIGSGAVKIEIAREKFVGDVIKKNVPNIPTEFDYPKFTVQAYSLETLMGEKTRAIIERGYLRDYHDVWKLLKEKEFNRAKAKEMFDKKCKAKGVVFSGVEQFFPEGIVETLKQYLETGLVRLSREPLPPIEEWMEELRILLRGFFS